MKRKWNNTIEIMALGLTAVTVSMAIFSLLTVDDADVKISAMNMSLATGCIISITALYLVILASGRNRKRNKKIYISYAEKDEATVRMYIKALQEILEKNSQYHVTYNNAKNSVAYGDNINDTLKKVIEKSDVILLYITNNYFDSKWAMKEYNLIKESEKVIIPILLEPLDSINDYPDELRDIYALELYNGVDNEEKIEDLASDIEKYHFLK
ncbi:MAG: toll/interleukin-1 receptor domain-containing protein [Eubacterium sp.]|nr:toll/interleukin-1 receptor domain-containing protein [Eubacterium sp.]